jgi:hypothetical protein
VAAVQHTFTHKQYTEYRERNIHNNKKLGTYKTIQKIKTCFWKCGPCPIFASYTLAFALQLSKKHGKTSVGVAARTSQSDTVQYKKNEQYNTQKENSNQD